MVPLLLVGCSDDQAPAPTDRIVPQWIGMTIPGRIRATASAARRSVWSVTAAYLRIIRSVFHPPRAITIGAVKPRLRAIVAPWWRRTWKWKSRRPAARAARRKTRPT